MVIGFVSIMLDDKENGTNFIQTSEQERKKLARESQQYNIEKYRELCIKFDQSVKPDGTFRTEQETKDFLENIKLEKAKKKELKKEKLL